MKPRDLGSVARRAEDPRWEPSAEAQGLEAQASETGSRSPKSSSKPGGSGSSGSTGSGSSVELPLGEVHVVHCKSPSGAIRLWYASISASRIASIACLRVSCCSSCSCSRRQSSWRLGMKQMSTASAQWTALAVCCRSRFRGDGGAAAEHTGLLSVKMLSFASFVRLRVRHGR